MTYPTSEGADPNRREARTMRRRQPGAARRARRLHACRTGHAKAPTQVFMQGEAESS